VARQVSWEIGRNGAVIEAAHGGDHWQRLGFPDRGVTIWSLTIQPARPNVMYSGAAPVALYRSTDKGVIGHVRVGRITVDPSG
jgi:hypothetical protein